MAYKPGQSGNPGGRPRSASLVARAVSERTGGGAEIVETMLRIARGEDKTYTERSRFAAWEWLADRLWGRAPMELEVTATAGPGADFRAIADSMRGKSL